MRGSIHPVRNRSLLCGSDAERGRLVDMSRRLSGAKRGATFALAVAVVIGMPTFGFWYSIPLAAAGHRLLRSGNCAWTTCAAPSTCSRPAGCSRS